MKANSLPISRQQVHSFFKHPLHVGCRYLACVDHHSQTWNGCSARSQCRNTASCAESRCLRGPVVIISVLYVACAPATPFGTCGATVGGKNQNNSGPLSN